MNKVITDTIVHTVLATITGATALFLVIFSLSGAAPGIVVFPILVNIGASIGWWWIVIAIDRHRLLLMADSREDV